MQLSGLVTYQKKKTIWLSQCEFFVFVNQLQNTTLNLTKCSLCMYHWLNAKDGWESRWVKSDWKKDENVAGEWNYTAGKWHGDPNDKGTLLNCMIFVYVQVQLDALN
jgi:hypothetical protein